MKKFLWSLSIIVSILSLTNCGGGSSKEAKELLSKMLQFVGIPPTIVANICQDANRDGTCGVGELFTKVTINKGDSIDDIWRKISLTNDGKYFLETYNPELPILVELQDVAKVNYDNGEFTLEFNGFKTKKDDNETKEISILEAMIDANALSKTVADKFRTLTNSEAQDKYYVALLDSLETNINTLRSNEINKTTAISATIKEMADEIKTNQEQADRINACGNDQTCIDNEIKKIKDELIIDENETEEIKKEQIGETPTADTSNDKNASSNQKGDFILPDGIMKDEIEENYKGKTIPNFIDLSEMSVNVTNSNIRVDITVVELPNQLKYNFENKGNGNNRYIWLVYFDTNDDNNVNIGFNLQLTGDSKDSNKWDSVIALLINYGDSHYPVNDPIDISSNVNINGNTITFDIPKFLSSDLDEITPLTKVRFYSDQFIEPDYKYRDWYPTH